MESDTPITDASLIDQERFVPEGLLLCSRNLERELSEAKAEIARLRKYIPEHIQP